MTIIATFEGRDFTGDISVNAFGYCRADVLIRRNGYAQSVTLWTSDADAGARFAPVTSCDVYKTEKANECATERMCEAAADALLLALVDAIECGTVPAQMGKRTDSVRAACALLWDAC